MNQLNKNKAGLVTGGFLGLWHVIWSMFAALGWLQALTHFVLRLHFVDISYKIMPFSIRKAVVLVAVASLAGYVLGYVVASIWNRVHKS